jgi:hypothetical protein
MVLRASTRMLAHLGYQELSVFGHDPKLAA